MIRKGVIPSIANDVPIQEQAMIALSAEATSWLGGVCIYTLSLTALQEFPVFSEYGGIKWQIK
jgi:hypothetical protein